jgi:uncharacterized protein (DUF1919 family)
MIFNFQNQFRSPFLNLYQVISGYMKFWKVDQYLIYNQSPKFMLLFVQYRM